MDLHDQAVFGTHPGHFEQQLRPEFVRLCGRTCAGQGLVEQFLTPRLGKVERARRRKAMIRRRCAVADKESAPISQGIQIVGPATDIASRLLGQLRYRGCEIGVLGVRQRIRPKSR